MTLLLGLKSDDFIVLASDGRISSPERQALGAGYSKVERLPCGCVIAAGGVHAVGEIVRFAARQAGPLASFEDLIQIATCVARGAHQASKLADAGAYNAVAVAGHDAKRQLQLRTFTSDDDFQAHDLASEPGQFRVFCAGLDYTQEVLRSLLGWANAATGITPENAVPFMRGIIREMAKQHPEIVSDECFFEVLGRAELAGAPGRTEAGEKDAVRFARVSANNLITGTTNKTVPQIEDGQTRATTAIKSDFNIADNRVISGSIQDAAVATAKIADLAVGTVKIADDAVTAVKRVDGAIAQDVPDNRLWNNWFQGTAGAFSGQPAAPTGYAIWQNALGSTRKFTGNGEIDLFNHATAPDAIQQLIDWSMVGNPGEDCVLMVEAKHITATSPTHDLRIGIAPLDDLAQPGTAITVSFAASLFTSGAYKVAVFKTTLPDVANLFSYRIKLENLSTGGTAGVDGYRIRRAMLSRSVDIPRWTSAVGRDRTTQQVTGGGGGGGGGGVPGGGGCPGGCVL